MLDMDSFVQIVVLKSQILLRKKLEQLNKTNMDLKLIIIQKKQRIHLLIDMVHQIQIKEKKLEIR